jgi:hypothetical protein
MRIELDGNRGKDNSAWKRPFRLLIQHSQELAKRVLSERAWAYYRSAGDDEIS